MKRCKRTAAWLLISLFCCVVRTGWATEIQVSAELDPPEFAENEQAQLTVTVNGTSSAESELPIINGLQVNSLGQSQRTLLVNGQLSASVAFTFSVQAEKPGNYSIGPIKVTADGTAYMTHPIACTVRPAQRPGNSGGTPSQAQVSSDEANSIGFLQIILERGKLYLGQTAPFTIKACFRPRMRVNLKKPPRLSGDAFLLHALDKEPTQRLERLDGVQCTVLSWQGILSAVKEGIVSLAAELDAEALVREQKGRSDPFFGDPFFDGFFDNYARKGIKLVSQAATMNVLSLPTKNRPADFKGAVGMFSLAVAASPTDGGPGEPIALKMKITGSGNFDLVQAPELSDSKGWKIYPSSTSLNGQGSKQEKVFEQAIVPTSSGLTAIPPLRFSYFDPAAEDYVTLSSEPIPLHLHGAAEPSLPPAQPQPTPAPPKQKHLAPPRTEPGEMVRAIRPLYDKRWFQSMMAAAGCCLTAGLLLDLHRKRREDDPDRLLRRQTERQMAAHFQEMQAAAAVQDQERFCRNCLEAVRKRAGATWGRAPEAITLADLQERLAADSPLLTIFARLEQRGYAGAALSQSEMEAMLQTIQQGLGRLA